MARNIEIKAKLTDDEFHRLVSDLGKLVRQEALLIQTDTFFKTPNSRLKLREFSEGSSELIAYDRPDQTGPRVSDYIRTPINHAELLKESLSRSIGIRGTVKKRRRLFLLGQTRVHLDEVEDLGNFVELEVVLRDNQSQEDGVAIAKQLVSQWEINIENLVDVAYIDLLESRNSDGTVK